MNDLIILGTGVHGAEMAHIVERINRVAPAWNLLGHIAHQSSAEPEFHGRRILGTIDVVDKFPAAHFVADNEFPKDMSIPRDRLVSVIDPSSFVHPSARLGAGCVVYPNCFIGLDAKLGEQVFMLAGAVINHDDVLEDRVVVCTNVSLAGSVHVERGCYLGQACTIRQHLRIGAGSLIGMGAVVVKDVPPNSVMVGNPATRLRDNQP